VTFVPADLSVDPVDGALAAAGFDPAAPAVIAWLGVTMYLTPEAVAATLAVIAGFAPGTEVIADYFLPEEARDGAGADYGRQVAAQSTQQASRGGRPLPRGPWSNWPSARGWPAPAPSLRTTPSRRRCGSAPTRCAPAGWPCCSTARFNGTV
jgi:O-methyltransferase involved in polyketide biosynthesis